MSKPEDFITVYLTLLPSQLSSVYALLGSSGLARGSTEAASAAKEIPSIKNADVKPDFRPISEVSDNTVESAQDGNGSLATTDVSPSEDIDADGHPFDAKLHTGTKTKAGLWRMKAGVSRPDPKPGFPKDAGTGTNSSGEASLPQPDSAPTQDAASTDDEDEFAAFRAAADKANATDSVAAANVPARKWTDADLGALCNQAAVKLGDPAPIKALIAEFVPDGEVPHSRNVPEEDREAFAQGVEEAAGITFAG